MREIFVLVEHRQGQIRDVTFEMLSKGLEIAETFKMVLTAVLLGKDAKDNAKTLSEYAQKVLLVEDVKFEYFNSEVYQKVLFELINKRKPLLTLLGQTAFGADLAPSLAVALDLPLATDCIDLDFNDDRLVILRQMYGGKVNVKTIVREAESYIITVRQAAFTSQNPSLKGEIIEVPSSLIEEATEKRFIEYVLPSPSAVDITSADILVGVGRGIKDLNNMALIEELAQTLGGVVACSRPIVDKKWLSSDRQVGTSGKTVKPKAYIAIGISGAFQHVLGMKNSELIIAINKDANAPIFNVADYGVINDLFKIVPELKNRVDELKGIHTKNG
jgi:electron transfer flavoprotein alpha subunit